MQNSASPLCWHPLSVDHAHWIDISSLPAGNGSCGRGVFLEQ